MNAAARPDFRPPDMRDVALPVLCRDPDFLLLDKPSGLLSVPGRGPYAQDSVVGRVRAWYPDAEGSLMVHRLDMDCSGLILVALDKRSQRELARQFEAREVEKSYQALVEGRVEQEQGRIELAFRLDPENRPRQIYDPVDGKLGITNFHRMSIESRPASTQSLLGLVREGPAGEEPLCAEDPPTRVASRIRFEPITGRTHQLRLHASHPLGLDRPILGDRLYGNPRLESRLMLHATGLAFRHPRSGALMQFESPPPF